MQAKRPNSDKWEEATLIGNDKGEFLEFKDNREIGRYYEAYFKYKCEIKIPITIFSESSIPRKI